MWTMRGRGRKRLTGPERQDGGDCELQPSVLIENLWELPRKRNVKVMMKLVL